MKPKIRNQEIIVHLIPFNKILIFMAAGLSIFEFVLHISDNTKFAMQNFGFLCFNLVGYISLKLMRKLKDVTVKEVGGWGRMLSQFVITLVAIFAVQFIIAMLMSAKQYSITSLEVYLFVMNAAISEEMFFRAFLIPMLELVLRPIIPDKNIRFILLVLLGATFFTVAHYLVYGTSQLMLLDVFLAGCIFSTMFLLTFNLFAVTMAHLVNNIIFAGVTITNTLFSIIEFSTPGSEAIVIFVFVSLIFLFTYLLSDSRRLLRF